MKNRKHQWNESWLIFGFVFVLFLTIAAIPFFMYEIPALVDYPNHLARLHILAGMVPEGWQNYYYVNEKLVPNLGLDVIGLGMINLGATPNEALKIFTFFAYSLPVVAVGSLAWVLQRRPPWIMFLAFPLGFNRYFVWGFLNYFVSLGFGLILFSVWIYARNLSETKTRSAWMCLVGLLLVPTLLCHLMGYCIAVVCILTYELGRNIETKKNWLPDSKDFRLLFFVLLPSILIYLFAIDHSSGLDVVYNEYFRSKASAIVSPFISYDFKLAAFYGGLIMGALFFLLRSNHQKLWPLSSIMPILCMTLIFTIAPAGMMGSDFLDKRLFIAVFIMILGLAAFRINHKGLLTLLVISSLIHIVRTIEVSNAWQLHSLAIKEIRHSLKNVPIGAKIVGYSYSDNDHMEFPPLQHAVMFAIIDRGAFVPSLFAQPFYGESVAYRSPKSFQKTLDTAPFDKKGQTTIPSKFSLACTQYQYVLISHMQKRPLTPDCFHKIDGGTHHSLYSTQ
jgi:hypothetical protein